LTTIDNRPSCRPFTRPTNYTSDCDRRNADG